MIQIEAAPVTIDPRKDPRWAALMRGPGGNLFGSPPWITAVAETYGLEVAADVLLDAAGTPTAGFAWVRVDDLRGARVISFPFSDLLDPVVDTDDEWRRLSDQVFALGVPIQLRVRRSAAPRRDPRFESVAELAWHGTDLHGSEDDLLARIGAKGRRCARSAVKHGVTVSFGSALGDVHAFHALHRQTRKGKYRLLAQPLGFFERIWEQFQPSGDLVVGLARQGDEIIAGALYLMWNGVMYYKFGASRPEGLAAYPNDLLARESLLLGRENGCHRYDWGVSDLDQPGLMAFKAKYATVEERVAVLRHRPAGWDDPRAAEAGRVLGDLTALLTDPEVPDEVTQRAGELLYRFFS